MIRCCKGCEPPDRHVGCHDTCEKYIEEKKADRERSRKVFEERMKESPYRNFAKESFNRMSKGNSKSAIKRNKY